MRIEEVSYLSVNERIREVRRSLGLTQDEFAARLGLKRNSVTMIESGRPTSDQTIFAICREFGIREEWLREGIEPMKSEDGIASEMTDLVDRLFRDRPDSFKARLISALLRYDPDGVQWRVLEEIYQSVAAEAGEAPMDERAALHAELDRQLAAEKGGSTA